MSKNSDWVGSGARYPKMFDKYTGSTKISTDDERLCQSILMILTTRIGERFFLPEFGSKLHELIFEPNDYILKDLLEMYTREALDIWEPRIQVIAVDAQVCKGENTVPIIIHYRISNSNITKNYVHPFQRSAMEID